ncbi:MAG: hypothetical protein H7Y07_16180, partial [Pyrinomonadaceae bacterium]|nr:hypothetical protein [Sphingobacteriaceae bacterium]
KYPEGVSAAGRGNFSPIWAMAISLFEKAGLNPVYCRQIIRKPSYAPEKSNSDHPGLGTLTFASDRKK